MASVTSSKTRGPNAPIRADQKANMHANARYRWLMRRRQCEGRQVVEGSVCRAVLGALINRSDQDGRCHPSIDLIALESDVNKRTVLRVLDILEEEQILERTQRNHVAGLPKSQTRNQYVISWSALNDCRAGGDLAPQPLDEDDDGRVTPKGNSRRSVTSSMDSESLDQVTATTDSGDSHDAIRRLSLRAIKEEPPIEPPIEPSPPAPQGGDGGGGGGELRSGMPESPTGVAAAIVAAYPPTSSDRPVADFEATQRAIASERGRADACSEAEILAAVHELAEAVRSGQVRTPLWCRTWMADRAYEPYVRRVRVAARQAVEASEREDRYAQARRVERQQAAAAVDRGDGVGAILAGMSIDELEAAKAEIVAEQAVEFQRRVWAERDPTTSSLLRREIARRVAAKREAVAA